MIPISSVQRDPKYYEDVDTFIPERFDDSVMAKKTFLEMYVIKIKSLMKFHSIQKLFSSHQKMEFTYGLANEASFLKSNHFFLS